MEEEVAICISVGPVARDKYWEYKKSRQDKQGRLFSLENNKRDNLICILGEEEDKLSGVDE